MIDFKQLRDLMRRSGEGKLIVSEDGDTYIVMNLDEFEQLSVSHASAKPGNPAAETAVENSRRQEQSRNDRPSQPLAEPWIEQELEEAPASQEEVHYEPPPPSEPPERSARYLEEPI